MKEKNRFNDFDFIRFNEENNEENKEENESMKLFGLEEEENGKSCY